MANEVVIVRIIGNCSFKGCKKPATHIAFGREIPYRGGPGHPGVKPYCEHHANIVVDEDAPEYGVDCPNCGCLFGVN